MLIELSQQRFKLISFESVLFQWVFQLIISVSQLKYLLLVLFRLLIDPFDLILMFFNQFEVVPSDLVVVILELSEGFFMVLHELIDV